LASARFNLQRPATSSFCRFDYCASSLSKNKSQMQSYHVLTRSNGEETKRDGIGGDRG